ncbi:hypothetical protein QQS21_001434 [Conoideocrella luteorostrata]|uniref:Zn(2)-C6 fungal-type domain-containing protein n=1 Tax=Conoideocrella luteorostrata TaxID=1105319 RepID=A0AAJ0G3E3_9HYPO|nr:hypothetical protein QQS21_001434 [Conoideocrella luteorostrata]
MSLSRRSTRACQRCRIRRIKCDLQKPNCSQCVRRSLRCPGYDHDSELQQVAQKKSPVAIQPRRIKPHAYSSLVASPNTPIEELTSCHFVANYILVPHLQGMRGFFQFVGPLLDIKDNFPHFKYAFDACSVASLNNRVGRSNDLQTLALGSYTRALTATRKALCDPSMAKTDATLAAVLLLGLYETISANFLGTMAWGSHIDGAIQLIKSRNGEQVHTQAGLDLFIAARTQMVIHTLSTGKPPDMAIEGPIKDRLEKEPVIKCQQLGIYAADLKAKATRLLQLPRTTETTELLKKLVRDCQSLDKDFASWSESLPDNFRWETGAWERPLRRGDFTEAEVYPGRIDIYQDVWAASVWNLMRCARIILTSVMIRCVARIQSPDDYRTTPEYAAATKIWSEAISDIISSVPYLLGWFSKRKDLLRGSRLSGFACGADDAEKTLSGYLLTWPLRCIQAQEYVTDSQRAWIRGRLRHIGAGLGVRTAIMPQIHAASPEKQSPSPRPAGLKPDKDDSRAPIKLMASK